VYVAFDQHPSYKGASTHIHHMCKVLSECFGPTLLLTVTSDQSPIRTEAIHQLTFDSDEPNLLKRANEFTGWVHDQLNQHYNLLVGHFRDVWGGMAILNHPHITPLYEANGFPSIELPMRYPQLHTDTIQKLIDLENYCLYRAQQIITPSRTIQQHIISRGIASEKIQVLPNGADIPAVAEPHDDLPAKYIVYAGAFQAWQGVDVLLKAMRYLEDKKNLPLVLCSSHTENHIRHFKKFAEKLGIQNQVIWKYQLAKPELQQILQHALVSVAPLIECSRNIEQGCSPLKIFESMACGVPVIASDLPVVREIISANQNGILVRAGRPAELARAIRITIDFPEFRTRLGNNARQTIQNQFTWQSIEHKLHSIYSNIFSYAYQT
jgi:glycosyltransferase involved in cell wall biosynthesis